jgi:hypothetical protein
LGSTLSRVIRDYESRVCAQHVHAFIVVKWNNVQSIDFGTRICLALLSLRSRVMNIVHLYLEHCNVVDFAQGQVCAMLHSYKTSVLVPPTFEICKCGRVNARAVYSSPCPAMQ